MSLELIGKFVLPTRNLGPFTVDTPGELFINPQEQNTELNLRKLFKLGRSPFIYSPAATIGLALLASTISYPLKASADRVDITPGPDTAEYFTQKPKYPFSPKSGNEPVVEYTEEQINAGCVYGPFGLTRDRCAGLFPNGVIELKNGSKVDINAGTVTDSKGVVTKMDGIFTEE